MRKLIFTLSSVNAVLNALVIAIFMPDNIIVLYGLNGAAKAYGSKWYCLIYVAIPLIISGTCFLLEKFSKKPVPMPAETAADDEEIETPFEKMLNGKSRHSDNLCMVLTWSFAIISWVMTGIALNHIENIGVILPSIIVIMLSAVMIFLTSIYSNAAPNAIVGIHLKWLDDDEAARKKANSFSFYMGFMAGLIGVCLAAWSLVISKNFPNCLAVVVLVVLAFILPIVYSYVVHLQSKK